MWLQYGGIKSPIVYMVWSDVDNRSLLCLPRIIYSKYWWSNYALRQRNNYSVPQRASTLYFTSTGRVNYYSLFFFLGKLCGNSTTIKFFKILIHEWFLNFFFGTRALLVKTLRGSCTSLENSCITYSKILTEGKFSYYYNTARLKSKFPYFLINVL